MGAIPRHSPLKARPLYSRIIFASPKQHIATASLTTAAGTGLSNHPTSGHDIRVGTARVLVKLPSSFTRVLITHYQYILSTKLGYTQNLHHHEEKSVPIPQLALTSTPTSAHPWQQVG